MKYLKKYFFHLSKSQRIGLYLLVIIILLFEIFQKISFSKNEFNLTESDKVLLEKYAHLPKEKNKLTLNDENIKDSIHPFNPNNLTKEDWVKLGFSDKQAQTILNYKKIVGGEFKSKEELKKCYVIDEDKYNMLAPYLIITPNKNNLDDNINTSTVNYKNFNPNDLTQQGWGKLGFTPKQAEIIMKYKQIIGGTFTSKEQLKKCYVISDEKFIEIKPYISLPEKSKQDEKLLAKQTKNKVNYKPFNPNLFTEKEWRNIGFTNKQAESILKYKKILGGKFTTKEQLKKCYVISDEKFTEIEPYILFDNELNNIENKKDILTDDVKIKLNPNDLTKEEWIKLGFSEKEANTILNFKKSLGGKFKNAEVFKKCYAINDEKYKELEKYLEF